MLKYFPGKVRTCTFGNPSFPVLVFPIVPSSLKTINRIVFCLYCLCSSVGNLKIVDVHSGGHYVKIVNSSCEKEEGIGDYTLQQNQNGHPLAIYRFPPKIRMKANSSVTVCEMKRIASNSPSQHN